MATNLDSQISAACDFIASLDFDNLPHYKPRFIAPPPPPFQPDANKNQSVVVGSGIISFTQGVTAERRKAISDSSLLAQLFANKMVPDRQRSQAWYDEYFKVLTNIGWVLQERLFNRFEASSDDMDVSQAILTIASGLLGGPAATSYQLIKLTLEAMKSMSANSPWIKLFSRETQHAPQTSCFQVSLVSEDSDGNFLVSLMAFDLQASTTLTQVLFFKLRSEQASLSYASGEVSINESVLMSVSKDIADKIEDFTLGYVKEMPDFSTSAG